MKIRVRVLTGLALGILCLARPSFAAEDSADGRKAYDSPRRSLYTSGFTLGYIFPAPGKYDYQKATGGILGSGTERVTPSHILRVTTLNAWQFDDLLLDADLWLGVLPERFMLGGDLNLNYLLGRGPVSPFVGGGAGIRWGPVDDDTEAFNEAIGPALSAQAGLLLFRAYDVNVIVRGQYTMTFNRDRDRGFLVDGGVTYSFPSGRDRDDRR